MRCPQALHRIGSRGLISFSEPQSARFHSGRVQRNFLQPRNARTCAQIQHLRPWRWSVFHGLLIIARVRLLVVCLAHGGEQATIVDSDQTCTRQWAERRCHTISFCYRLPILPSTLSRISPRNCPLLREIRSPQIYPLGAHRRLLVRLQR
jgi:hypothetical protein